MLAQTSETTTPSPSVATTGLPTIQITSVQDGQQVPPGELTIEGISSDNEDSDCNVYADTNDITPMQNVTAAGDSGEANDFSKWIFSYTQAYQLIKQGGNELTAKISCIEEGESNLNSSPDGSAPGDTTAIGTPVSEWHTVNVTGITGAPPVAVTTSEDSGDTETESEDGSDGSDVIRWIRWIRWIEDGSDGSESEDGEDDGNGGNGGDDGFGGFEGFGGLDLPIP